MGDIRRAYRILVGRPEKYHLADLCVRGRIILKWIFKIGMGRPGLDGVGSG
jgi:hypothetical protein